MTQIFFEVKTPLNKIIRTTKEYWNYLIEIKHANVNGHENEVINTLNDPDMIRRSKIDEDVFLYYKKAENFLYCVVTRHENGTGYLITAYLTDKLKEGESVWTK